MCSMHGRFTMGIMGLGWSLVSGLSRVPCPPAMMTAFIGSLRFASLRGVGSRESGVGSRRRTSGSVPLALVRADSLRGAAGFGIRRLCLPTTSNISSPFPCYPFGSMPAASCFPSRVYLTACQHSAARVAVLRATRCGAALPAALDPYSYADAPEVVAFPERVLDVAQVALGEVFGPVGEEREPRGGAAGLGGVTDLDAFGGALRATTSPTNSATSCVGTRACTPGLSRPRKAGTPSTPAPVRAEMRTELGLRSVRRAKMRPSISRSRSAETRSRLFTTTPHEEPASSISRAILRSPATMPSTGIDQE